MAKSIAALFGLIFTVIGLLGFVLPSPLFGLFEVDVTHNVIHILTGLIGLLAAKGGKGPARTYLLVFGIVYAIVAVLGFTMNGDILGFFHANMEDNILHTVTALVFLIGSAKK